MPVNDISSKEGVHFLLNVDPKSTAVMQSDMAIQLQLGRFLQRKGDGDHWGQRKINKELIHDDAYMMILWKDDIILSDQINALFLNHHHCPNLLGFASGLFGNSPAKVLAAHDEE